MQNCSKYQLQTAVREPHNFVTSQHRLRLSARLAKAGRRPAESAGSGSTPAPLSHWQKKNMSELLKRQFWRKPNSARFEGFNSFAGKSTASFAAARLTSTSKARRVCERICKIKIGVKIENLQKYRRQKSKNQPLSAVVRGVVQESRAVSEVTKNVCCNS